MEKQPDDRLPPDLLSQLLPDALEALGLGAPDSGDTADNAVLAQRLQMLAGQGGGPLQAALQDFLQGQGELHATTQAAAARGGRTTQSTLETLLEKQFHLAPAVAKIFAGLLIKLFPATKKTASKPKPRRKPKPKNSTRPKTASSASGKKPKKDATSKPKKTDRKTAKSTAKKPTARRKTRSQTDLSSET